MTDTEKTKIRSLDEKADYIVWRVRVRSAISAKILKDVLSSLLRSTDKSNARHFQDQSITKFYGHPKATRT